MNHNAQKISIMPAFCDISKPITLDYINVNNKTSVANQDAIRKMLKCLYRKTCLYVDIKEMIKDCYDENITNDETDLASPADIECQKNIFVSTFNKTIVVQEILPRPYLM
ncbi:uncharacterized protein LOC126852043 isoform X2 [Cataglyphis hispanica]|nr:uncharacterized protein LOC126852043 isoform X2 [Cataglyphis hispanica]